MSKASINEIALDGAIYEACMSMLDALPTPSECRHSFSPAFELKMEKLILTHRRRNALRRCLRSAAAFFLAFILGSGIFLGVNAEARAAFFSWVREVYESSAIYRFRGAHEAYEVLPEVELTWFPNDNYIQVSSFLDNTISTSVWVDEDDSLYGFVFTCNLIVENMLTGVDFGDEDDCMLKTVYVNGLKADFYISQTGEPSTLIWTDTDKGIVFTLNSNLDTSVILNIADGVKLAD